jgi:integrase
MRGKLSISKHSKLLSDGEPIAWIDKDGALKTEPGRYGDGRGLYLQLGDGEAASWLFRYERGGRERWLGLGSLDWVPVAPGAVRSRPNVHEMRAAAQKARDQLREGIDPIDEKKKVQNAAASQAAKEMTFREAAETWHKKNLPTYKNAKHAKQVLTTLQQYAFPKLGRLNVSEIDTPHVVNVLEPIWHKVPETASRLRGRIEGVLGWATVSGYRQGLNPARWTNHLSELLPATGKIANVKSHAALPYPELPAFMADLAKREAPAARALELTILCATRTNETVGARWPEVDWEQKIWTIPAERMKGKKNQRREHRVPLSERAVGLLKKMYEMRDADDGFIFIGAQEGKPISNMAMDMLLRRMNVKTDDKGQTAVTVHGFRSTFRDWLGERTSFPNHVAEMCLAHVIENKAEAAYRRGDLLDARRKVMRSWADYCYGPVVKSAQVIPMKGVAK